MEPPKGFDAEAVATLEALGFTGSEEAGTSSRLRFEKYNCAVVFERDSSGRYRLLRGPGYVVAGEISRLWDAGYQKFLLTEKGRFPATTDHLKALHRFDEELRAALGVANLYNEALGTTCDVTAYDRVQGRPQ